MKKFLALALALVMALSLAACGKKADDNKGNGDEAKGSVYYLNHGTLRLSLIHI